MYNDRAGCDHETEYKREAQDLSPAAHEADVEGTAYEKGKTQGHMKLWKPREKLFLKERSNTTLMRDRGFGNPHAEELGSGRETRFDIYGTRN